MLKFILNNLIMFSLGAILYLVAKTLPKIKDDALNVLSAPKPHWTTIYLEKFDEWFKVYLEKFLRRIRVWLLKLDNYVSQKLGGFKKESPKDAKQLPLEDGSSNKEIIS